MISIVIPVYNHQESLEKALASIEAQTYQDCEVIVVDDGSTEEVRLQTSNFRFPLHLVRQENKGAPAARNAGLALAKGEYVIFWDADVVGEPEMLEKMVSALAPQPEASIAYTNHYFGKKKMQAMEWNTDALMHHNYIHSTSLIRRDDALLWDESLKRFQDWDLWLSMSKVGKTGVWIDEYLFHVDTGGSMSTWLPRCAYKKPWRWVPGFAGKVRKYEEARDVVRPKWVLFFIE